MSKKYGCPHCGHEKARAKATLGGNIEVRFSGPDSADYEVNEDFEESFEPEEVDDVEDSNGFTCSSCGEDFEDPVLIVDKDHPAYRVQVKVAFSVFGKKMSEGTKDLWVEEQSPDIDQLNDSSLKFWVTAKDIPTLQALLRLLRKVIPTTSTQAYELLDELKDAEKPG